jgi:hypothetical protein
MPDGIEFDGSAKAVAHIVNVALNGFSGDFPIAGKVAAVRIFVPPYPSIKLKQTREL